MSQEAARNESVQSGNLHGLLTKKLQNFDTLSGDETRALDQAISGTRSFAPDTDLVALGSTPVFSTLLVDGWAARYKTLENGARQISAVHIPGDFVDLHSFLLKPMDHGVLALSACRVAMIPHERLREITETQPHLTRLLWLNTLVDAAMHREWLVDMGRLQTVVHLAHLLCELYQRLHAVGLIAGQSFEFPATQASVADILGLSTVHVNRAVQDIRARGFVSWQNKTVTVLDWEALKVFAQFDPTYLYQVRRPR